MRVKSALFVGFFAVAGFLVGCEKEETKPAAETPSVSHEGPPAEPEQKVGNALSGAADKAKEMGSSAATEATKMIDQVKTYIQEKKFTDADAVMDKLEAMRAQVPESVQKMIDNCKEMLDKAKAAAK